jgi:hypothetical protein
MPRSQRHDPEILRAALVGLQHTIAKMDEKIVALRTRLGGTVSGAASSIATGKAARPTRRVLSVAARKRIALAQKKRWAALKADKRIAAKAAAKPRRRKLSAQGRARIVAATKKRWAAFHKTQARKSRVGTQKSVAKARAKKTPSPKPAPAPTPQVTAAAPLSE